ncbi:MAG: hypothetical protein F6K10_31165 [Moorea sp. SIO2B7]|nr:hypothetical protein [Moorena sp. SIO2B7]
MSSFALTYPKNIVPPSTSTFPEWERSLPKPQQQKSSPSPQQKRLPAEGQKKIVVKRFEFVGSSLFSTEQLAAVTAPFTDRLMSLMELLQVRSVVTQLYVDNGYITSESLYLSSEVREKCSNH